MKLGPLFRISRGKELIDVSTSDFEDCAQKEQQNSTAQVEKHPNKISHHVCDPGPLQKGEDICSQRRCWRFIRFLNFKGGPNVA